MHKRLGKSQNGFTIVELLVVIVVIGILAAISIVAYNGITVRVKENAIKQSLSQVSRVITAYKVSDTNEDYPATLAAANVPTTGNVTYQYTVDNATSTKSFCITGSMDGIRFFFSSIANEIASGSCPGHSVVVYQTAAGWDSYPVPWSTSTTEHGYGLYYGVYYPSTLKAENSGSLTLFNPLATTASQGGVNTYLWCRNTSTNAINTSIVGSTFGTFNASTPLRTITWSCPASTVLYALNIGSTNPGGNTPDSLTGTQKARTWYSPQSPNHKAPQPYTLPSVAVDAEGWKTMPIPWGGDTYSDTGYGPYYGVYIANDPAKNLSAVQTGTLQLYNPYSNSRAQGGVNLHYWCKNTTSGLVSQNSSVGFGTFNATQTREVTWTCPVGTKLYAAALAGSLGSTYYPNEETSKSRYWFSGESIQVYPAYLDSVRTMHGE